MYSGLAFQGAKYRTLYIVYCTDVTTVDTKIRSYNLQWERTQLIEPIHWISINKITAS